MTKTGLDRLKKSEGLRLRMYKDTEGINTVGYGFNMDDQEIPMEVANLLLSYSVIRAENDAVKLVSNWCTLSFARRDILIDMTFNMGLTRIRGFKRMLFAVEAEDFETAAIEMLDSRWARQVGVRAQRLAAAMRAS